MEVCEEVPRIRVAKDLCMSDRLLRKVRGHSDVLDASGGHSGNGFGFGVSLTVSADVEFGGAAVALIATTC